MGISTESAAALRAINARFYERHAAEFAAKRTRPWPGMRRLLAELQPAPRTVLDAGCGNGRFAAMLAEYWRNALAEGAYTGADASAPLLNIARRRADLPRRCEWLRLDFVTDAAALPHGPYDLVALFAVAHHVPGEAARAALLRAVAARVAPGGALAASFWRSGGGYEKRGAAFCGAGIAGIDSSQMDAGDELQRWGGNNSAGDNSALRYMHFADDAELQRMARAPGLTLAAQWRSDGASGAANQYYLWRRAL